MLRVGCLAAPRWQTTTSHGGERDGRQASNQLSPQAPARPRNRSCNGWHAWARRRSRPGHGLCRREPPRGRVVPGRGDGLDSGHRIRAAVPWRAHPCSCAHPGTVPARGSSSASARRSRTTSMARETSARAAARVPTSRAAPSPSEAGRPLASPSHAPLEPALGPAPCRRRAQIVAPPSRCASPSVLRWHEPDVVEEPRHASIDPDGRPAGSRVSPDAGIRRDRRAVGRVDAGRRSPSRPRIRRASRHRRRSPTRSPQGPSRV